MSIGLVKPRRDLTEIRPEDRRAAPKDQLCGVLISRPYEGGAEVSHDLIQCKHCEQVWVYVKDSGRVRGWCMNCNGYTCGRPECDPCVSSRQMLANMEAGLSWRRAKRHRPIVGRVEAAPPKAVTRSAAKTAGGILLPG